MDLGLGSKDFSNSYPLASRASGSPAQAQEEINEIEDASLETKIAWATIIKKKPPKISQQNDKKLDSQSTLAFSIL